jgi:hypothetical protein
MRISPTDQLDADIDYFATDAAGHILHVASGGGVLPESVAADEAALLALHQYFLTLPETGAALLAPGLPAGLNYDSFRRYARRGLFSFEKVHLHEPLDTQYRLVARPARPLMVAELPESIRKLLGGTQLPGPVASADTLDSRTIR